MKELLEERIQFWEEAEQREQLDLDKSRDVSIEHIRSCEENLNYIRTILYELRLIYNSESPQCVSDSLEASDDLHTGYQMEGGADSDTNTNEAVTVPLPKRSGSEKVCGYCGGSGANPFSSTGDCPICTEAKT